MSSSKLEAEKVKVVYPAYDNVQVLLWAIANPKEWRRKKDEVRKVRRAYRDLGAILKKESNTEIIGAWFGDDTGEVVRSMREVREKVHKLIPR
ncbi:hypothetical protein HYT95_02170 [Candidatus Peregrinibacteria bacterium]|nr:hypothetical protein [Candidatus Peregrinibacteria bacterium]